MASVSNEAITQAQVVLLCQVLEPTLEFFTERLGFRLDAINPADAPSVAILSGYGLRLELKIGQERDLGVLRLLCRDPAQVAGGETQLLAPNGTRIELVDADPPVAVPPMVSSFVLSRFDATAWGTGRAGMGYRDLIPDRQGGRFIASHIQVPDGGPIPDYVHYHKIRFQMIYCFKGWCRVVYEDQGPPFVMAAGDCVLQPPQIRHRVLESSAGFEVVEIGCPASHETFADHDLELPTPVVVPDRAFGGQRYVLHRVAEARWEPFRLPGFECRDTGIGRATGGLASARVARPTGDAGSIEWQHEAEFVFFFVLAGTMTLNRDSKGAERVGEADAFVLPSGTTYGFSDCSSDLELLEVSLPASFETLFESSFESGRAAVE